MLVLSRDISRYVSVPVAALAVSALVLRGSFHRVEHVLLALSAVFVTYFVAGFLARPDWGAAAEGMVVPSIPLTRDAMLIVVATVGTTLAPWGLAFIQSYAVNKRLRAEDLRLERVDVVVGAVLTGIIGAFVVVACAATLHPEGVEIDDAADAARARAVGRARSRRAVRPGLRRRGPARRLHRRLVDRVLGVRGDRRASRRR